VVWPGQATSYKVGRLAILRMRERAKRELGDRFDIKSFREVLLTNGSIPPEILDPAVTEVGYWVQSLNRN